MKTTIEIEVKDFQVPSFAILKDAIGDEGATSIPLSMLDSDALHRLCQNFRDEVFKKAKKQQPPTAG
jgi:hypothetical protein